MAWVILVISGMFEVVWAFALAARSMKLWLRAVIFVFGGVVSMGGLALALRTIPVGVGYAVWIGAGAVTTVVVSFMRGHEKPTALRLACVFLVVAGVVGLQVMV
ncbi:MULTISPECIES: DMT family transporter [Brevibacterium]|uniref:DMT family transporter n=1 Tax=Brevibacterium sp. ACRRH TaxID=2918183 RepID=UPI0023B7DF62|nr:SMR family transporter [Brevibacterium sp. ACRRH]